MIRAENQFELTFPAKSENEGFARQCVAMFLSRLDPTVGELADLRTAVLKDLAAVAKTLNDQGAQAEGAECGVVLLPTVEEEP